MTKARILADFISDGSSLADGTISVAEVSGAAPLASPTFTGTASGTFSGPLTGAVTGNVTGAVTGNVTGNLTGAVTVLGNLTMYRPRPNSHLSYHCRHSSGHLRV
jgi:hypothetical protein